MKTLLSAWNGRRQRAVGPKNALWLATVLSLTILIVGACSDKAAPPTFPQPIPEVPRNWLYAVVGTGPNDIYACGAKGAMFRFDGTSWTMMATGSNAPIVQMWDDGTGVLYAVGHGGKIWKKSGTTWAGMTSGTTEDMFGIGRFNTAIVAVGNNGTIRRLNGGSWGGMGSVMVQLDQAGNPLDTLSTNEDLATLVAVNSYFLGGAYLDPLWGENPRIGTEGTKGAVLATNDIDTLNADWILRPITGEQRVETEWVYCTTSDPANLSRNYLGTSEGWLFRLTLDEGRRVWSNFYPSVTGLGAGIRDLWLDAVGNLYMVTDEGTVVYQTVDYNFVDGTGRREILFDSTSSLTGIWGTGPENLYFVGLFDNTIFHADHDTLANTFTVETITVDFGSKGLVSGPAVDKLNQPVTWLDR